MIGLGTVGSGVAKLLKANAQQYALRTGTTLELVGVLVRDTEKAMMTGLVDQAILTNDPDAFFAQEMDVVLEVAGGVEVAGNFVRRAIEKKCHVVTANKALLAEASATLDRLRHYTKFSSENSNLPRSCVHTKPLSDPCDDFSPSCQYRNSGRSRSRPYRRRLQS